MKSNKILFSLVLALVMSTGCNNSNSTSQNESNVNSSNSSLIVSSESSSSSSVFKGYVDIFEAFANTQHYGIRYDTNYTVYLEIYNGEMYYMPFMSQNYIILDSDPNFAHSFTTRRLSDDVIDMTIDVYGRAGSKNDIKTFEERNFMSLFKNQLNKFKKSGENTWEYESRTLCKTLSTFFQTNSLKYCNLVEFEIDKNDRLCGFKMFEAEGNQKVESFSVILENVDNDDLDMYNRWKDDGALIQERIIDYKMLYENDKKEVISVYNGDTVEFNATVVAKDSYGNIYVANEDKKQGNTGIKVTPKAPTSVDVGDIVTVKGEITTDKFVVSMINAIITDTGNDSLYPPIFDEEMIVDSYGGGTYAAQIFSANPFYAGSVYTTYAYVNDIPEAFDSSNDIIIEVICPTYTNGEITYCMEVIIPNNLPLDKKEELYNSFYNAGKYGDENAKELNIANFILQFDVSYYYGVKLMATEASEAYPTLNPQEKIEKFVGLENIPVITTAERTISYRFGGASGQFIERNYGLEGDATQGVYVGFLEVADADYEAFLQQIGMYGAELYDIVKDAFAGKHYIYKYNDTVIDIQAQETGNVGVSNINMWVYNGEIIRTPNIKENLNSKIGSWFNKDNFLVLEGTNDYSYQLFELYDYANIDGIYENPMYCVTLDTQENIRDNYCKGLIQKLGYSQYKVNNKAYTYITRGQVHYVFQKDGVILDVASYPTSDYTYAGHSEYAFRLEILIYQGDKPLEIPTYTNLDVLESKYTSINEEFGYDISLPSDSVIEIWNNLNNFNLAKVDYGYGCRDEAFIYTDDVEGAYTAIEEGLIASGYTKSYSKTYSMSFKKVLNGETVYIFVLKEPDKGYVRFMHGVGGMDFSR